MEIQKQTKKKRFDLERSQEKQTTILNQQAEQAEIYAKKYKTL